MIDRDQVRKVAHLARLRLTPEEETAFAGQLSSILDYVQQLEALDVADVEPTARAIETRNVLRPDQPLPCLPTEELLRPAPDREDPFFRVPQILQDN